nr:hypothetical protein [Tanacetum cinerariifolium]
YDCQQQFPFFYEQEPSYNQNYDDNYYPHGYQNVDFSGSDQIQTSQYPDVNPPSPEIKYDQSTSTDRPIFLNDNENHPVQNKESPENSSEENVVSKTNQEPPQDLDIHQLIEECSIKVSEEQKQKMENTMLELEQEVKNVIEQPAERGNCSIQSLQNFRVVHKSSISLNNSSQMSSIHTIAPILSTKEPEHLLSMGYEHLNIT